MPPPPLDRAEPPTNRDAPEDFLATADQRMVRNCGEEEQKKPAGGRGPGMKLVALLGGQVA